MIRPYLLYLSVALLLLSLTGCLAPWPPFYTMLCWFAGVTCAIPVIVRVEPLAPRR